MEFEVKEVADMDAGALASSQGATHSYCAARNAILRTQEGIWARHARKWLAIPDPTTEEGVEAVQEERGDLRNAA